VPPFPPPHRRPRPLPYMTRLVPPRLCLVALSCIGLPNVCGTGGNWNAWKNAIGIEDNATNQVIKIHEMHVSL
jgi:hypothetical protein